MFNQGNPSHHSTGELFEILRRECSEPFKWGILGSFMACFFTIFFLTQLFPKAIRILMAQSAVSWGSRSLLSILGANLKVTGVLHNYQRPLILAGNHLSWIDPFLMLSREYSLFLTSTDVANHPFLGFLTRLGGCRFLDRRGNRIDKELEGLCQDLDKTGRLVFFPEATTGDGSVLLPFKSSLFDLSFRTETLVQAFVIRYLEIDGQEVSRENREKIYYYGNVSFASHLRRVLRLKKWRAELIYGPLFDPKDYGDRKQMSLAVWNWVNANANHIDCSFPTHNQFAIST